MALRTSVITWGSGVAGASDDRTAPGVHHWRSRSCRCAGCGQAEVKMAGRNMHVDVIAGAGLLRMLGVLAVPLT
jgi:hypothetical protein